MADVELRWDLKLSDDALVVRGGTMDHARLWLNANTVLLESGVWGICVGAADDATAYYIARSMPYRGNKMRVSSVGILRGAGFSVVLLQDRPHAVLLLNDEPTGEDWEGWDRLRQLFTEPQVIPR